MLEKSPIDINSDENADWIKLVHDGITQRQELIIHDELAKRADDDQRDAGLGTAQQETR